MRIKEVQNVMIRSLSSILVVLLLSGCGFMAVFSPEFAIDKYQRIGVVNFSSSNKGNLNELVSQEFLKDIRRAGKKSVIIELGNESNVLDLTHQTEFGAAAINAIGNELDLDAIIIGNMEILDINPRIESQRRSGGRTDIGGNPLTLRPDNTPAMGYKSMRAKFDLDASLNVSLIETKSAKTVWTGSVRERKAVAPLNMYAVKDTSGVFFDERDSKDTYDGLTKALSQSIINKLRIK